MNYGNYSPKKIYWSSAEVVELTGVPSHTLRYWEEVVPYLQVPKNRAKKKMYRQQDIDFILALKAELELLDGKETISSVGEKVVSKTREKPVLEEIVPQKTVIEERKPNQEVLKNLRSELLEAISRLNSTKKVR